MNSRWSLLLGLVFIFMLLLVSCGCFNSESVPRSTKPAGKNSLLITMGGSIYSVDKDGTHLHRLIEERVKIDQGVKEAISYEMAEYSPDRKTIAVELYDERDEVDSNGKLRSLLGYANSLCLADANGKNVRKLADISSSSGKEPLEAGIGYLQWAPDGKKIYYVDSSKGSVEGDFFTVDMNGRQKIVSQRYDVHMTDNVAVCPAGNRIAYVEYTPEYLPFYSGPSPALMVAGIRGSRISGPREVSAGTSQLNHMNDSGGTLAWLNKQEVVTSITTNTTTGQQVKTTNGETLQVLKGVGQELKTVNVTSNAVQQIYTYSGSKLSRLSASPDGKSLSFLLDGKPMILDIASRTAKPLQLPARIEQGQPTDLSW